jgi:hypothetical protein
VRVVLDVQPGLFPSVHVGRAPVTADSPQASASLR